jgi:hypothetical protein
LATAMNKLHGQAVASGSSPTRAEAADAGSDGGPQEDPTTPERDIEPDEDIENARLCGGFLPSRRPDSNRGPLHYE